MPAGPMTRWQPPGGSGSAHGKGSTVEADEYRELDEERVLVLARFARRGKTSGLEIGEVWTKAASVFQTRDGKVTKLLWRVRRPDGPGSSSRVRRSRLAQATG
jgi:hypothetical protein